ncbi:MAG TPA: PAS domain S-box protein [Dokdonella sp.]
MIDDALRVQDRHQLRQIVAGISEGVMLIESDHAIVWANAAACAMHGVSDAAELGRTAAQYRKRFELRYRNHHKLAPASYPIDRVIAGEILSDVVVEVTPKANPQACWVHRVRSLVLTNAQEQPDGLVLIFADVTDWASAEQRFEKTFNANPAPAVICRLDDLRYVRVNQGFLEMTGYERDQVIGRSTYELDVLAQAERKDLAIERLGAGETIPQMEAQIRVPGGGTKLVVVAGQPIEIGDDACMLFTFIDLEPRRLAETALRQSEERFAKAFRMTPVPTLVCDLQSFKVIDINEAFAAATGYAAAELVGAPIEDAGFVEPERMRTHVAAALGNTGGLQNVEYRIRRKDGEVIDCLVSAESVQIQGAPCFLMALLDITHRKQSEIELVSAIEAVMEDASWLSQTLVEKIANVRRGSAPDRGAQLADLTPRERDVLGLICEGLADKEIAARLKVAPSTIRNHVARMYSKLDVHSRSEAIVWARERGVFGRARRGSTGRKT